MKKLLGILVLGLLWSSISFAETKSPNKYHLKCNGNNNSLDKVRDVEIAKLFDKVVGWVNRHPGPVKDKGSKFELYVKKNFVGDARFVEYFYEIEKEAPIVRIKAIDDKGKILEEADLNCKIINDSLLKS